MVNGSAVRIGDIYGKIQTVITAIVGDTLVVLKLYVQPNGVNHAWPVNPHNVDSINILLN